MTRKLKQNGITKKDIELLLQEQTGVILEAVDGRLEKFETRFNRKLDQLIYYNTRPFPETAYRLRRRIYNP